MPRKEKEKEPARSPENAGIFEMRDKALAELERIRSGLAGLKSGLWQVGYHDGVRDVMRALLEDPEGTLERAKSIARPMYKADRAEQVFRVASDPAAKAARTQQLKRMARDEAQAAEFAALIRSGETTESARTKMGIGAVRAKRLRAIGVKLKWIRRRQRKAGTIP